MTLRQTPPTGRAGQHQRPVILMRPGAANDSLAELLERSGVKVWRWPAFDIALPLDQILASERLSHLDDVEMVVLASPAAVAAVAHWVREWPSHITLATIGEGTAKAIRAAWGDGVRLIYPKGAAQYSGSEALFALVRKQRVPSRVLICRGQTGRPWLSEQLVALGADVETLTTYLRLPLELTPQQATQLDMAVAGPAPIVYLTSTDAVPSLMHAVKGVPGAREWILGATVLTIHPRCADRLRYEGFGDVEITDTDEETVCDLILSRLRGSSPA